MPVVIDQDWFRGLATDEATRDALNRIFRLRERVLAENRFFGSEEPLELRLGMHRIVMDERSSFSVIETYQEIFRDRGHRRVPGFDGVGAGVVLDVGANRGFYSMAIRESNPTARIVAAEPNPREFAALEAHIRLNALAPIVAEPVAVETREGDSWMDIVPEIGPIGGQGLRDAPRPWMKPEFIRRIAVRATTLDALCRRHGLESVDLLKIDVEGMEADVVESTRVLDRVGRLVVEYHSADGRDRLLRAMRDRGFDAAGEDHADGSYYGDLYFRNPKATG